jgi:hypothetical protein
LVFFISVKGRPAVKRWVVVIAILAALLLSSCTSVTPAWQKAEFKTLRDWLEPCKLPIDTDLIVEEVNSFDGRTILLGGNYGWCRSALLRSADGGKTWKDIDVWLYASEVCEIFFLDAQHVWFVTCWTMESKGAPYYVFRSTDAGKTWQRSETELPSHIETSLSWITGFSFSSPADGEIAFKSTVGDFQTYATSDGGVTYHLKSRAKFDPDEAFDEPQSPSVPPPFIAETAWQRGIIYIKSTQDGGKTYNTLGTLPYYYTFKDLKVIPKQVK